MKTIYLLFIVGVLSCSIFKNSTSAEAQQVKHSPVYKLFKSYNGDTVKYLKENFEGRKNYYAGKPLNIVFNDLEIPIKSLAFAPYWDKKDKIQKVNHLLFHFEDTNTVLKKKYHKKDPISLTVELKNPIPFKEVESSLSKKWSQKESEFWGKLIINNILVAKYF